MRQTPTPSPPISETDFRYPNRQAGVVFGCVRAGEKRNLCGDVAYLFLVRVAVPQKRKWRISVGCCAMKGKVLCVKLPLLFTSDDEVSPVRGALVRVPLEILGWKISCWRRRVPCRAWNTSPDAIHFPPKLQALPKSRGGGVNYLEWLITLYHHMPERTTNAFQRLPLPPGGPGGTGKCIGEHFKQLPVPGL